MKTIPNTVYPTNRKDGSRDTVSKLIIDCLNVPPKGGLDFAEMRARLRVADLVEKVPEGGEIKLEDAEHATVIEAIKGTRWLIINQSLIKFGELFGM